MKRVLRSGPPNNSCDGRSGDIDGGDEFAGRAENVDLACGDVDVAFRSSVTLSPPMFTKSCKLVSVPFSSTVRLYTFSVLLHRKRKRFAQSARERGRRHEAGRAF